MLGHHDHVEGCRAVHDCARRAIVENPKRHAGASSTTSVYDVPGNDASIGTDLSSFPVIASLVQTPDASLLAPGADSSVEHVIRRTLPRSLDNYPNYGEPDTEWTSILGPIRATSAPGASDTPPAPGHPASGVPGASPTWGHANSQISMVLSGISTIESIPTDVSELPEPAHSVPQEDNAPEPVDPTRSPGVVLGASPAPPVPPPGSSLSTGSPTLSTGLVVVPTVIETQLPGGQRSRITTSVTITTSTLVTPTFLVRVSSEPARKVTATVPAVVAVLVASVFGVGIFFWLRARRRRLVALRKGATIDYLDFERAQAEHGGSPFGDPSSSSEKRALYMRLVKDDTDAGHHRQVREPEQALHRSRTTTQRVHNSYAPSAFNMRTESAPGVPLNEQSYATVSTVPPSYATETAPPPSYASNTEKYAQGAA